MRWGFIRFDRDNWKLFTIDLKLQFAPGFTQCLGACILFMLR